MASTQSLSLAANTDYVSVGSTASVIGTFTITGWVKPSATSGTNMFFEHLGGGGDYAVSCRNGALCLTVFGVANNDFSTLTFSADTWHFFAVRVSGTTAKGFLRPTGGSLSNESLTITAPSGTPSNFRAGDSVFSQSMIGLIDELAAFSSSVSDGDIANLADGTTDPGTLSPTLLWRFEEGTGTTTADDSGNGYDGTLNGTSGWSSDVPDELAGGSDTFTATAALTHAGASLAASATFGPGTHTATAALTHSGASLSASATFSPGTHTAAAALAHAGATLSASATFSPGTKTAAAALTHSGATLAASAIFASGVFQATSALTHAGATLSASATFGAGSFTAASVLVHAGASLVASATFRPRFTATAALVHPGASLAAVASAPPGTWYLCDVDPADPLAAGLAGNWALDIIPGDPPEWRTSPADPGWSLTRIGQSPDVWDLMGTADGLSVIFEMEGTLDYSGSNTFALFGGDFWTTPTTLTVQLTACAQRGGLVCGSISVTPSVDGTPGTTPSVVGTPGLARC